LSRVSAQVENMQQLVFYQNTWLFCNEED